MFFQILCCCISPVSLHEQLLDLVEHGTDILSALILYGTFRKVLSMLFYEKVCDLVENLYLSNNSPLV